MNRKTNFVAITVVAIFVTLTSVIFTGCNMPKKVPFTCSSMDKNNGNIQSVVVVGSDLDSTSKTLIILGEKRGLHLTDRKCNEQGCRLVFKIQPENAQKTVGIGYVSSNAAGGGGQSSVQTINIQFASKIYTTLERQGDTIKVDMIGVPEINGTTSCPKILMEREKCVDPGFYVMGDDTPAKSFRQQWGMDISGEKEYEYIGGMLSELELAGKK